MWTRSPNSTESRVFDHYIEISSDGPWTRTGRATLIKSIMTQAILYGSNLDVGQRHIPFFPAAETSASQNPLNFSFPPEVDGNSLMTGAEQLSKAILESGDA